MTKDQIKEGMIERVEKLKERREAARIEEVERKLNKRFKEGADELRRVEANIKENLTQIDREKQIVEKQKIMENNFNEEMFYAELWRRDKVNKDRAEAEVAQRKKEKNDARNEILAMQYQQMQEARHQSELQAVGEKQMLKEQWDIEDRNQKALDDEQARIKAKMHTEIRAQNIMHKEHKEMLHQAEKDMDRDRVRQIIEKERILDQLDQEKKDKYKADTKQFLLNFKNRSDEAK